MSRFEILNRAKHGHLRVMTQRSADLGDSMTQVMTFPMEFRDIQSCYPILFTKDPGTGAFFAAALFGFDSGQNVFLQSDGWHAAYVPLMVRRQPFLIATPNDTSQNKDPVVSLDTANARVSEQEGEVLFLDDGEPSEYLQSTIEMLRKIHEGLTHSQGFIDALLSNELLEPITLDITFDNGAQKSLQGYYSIAEENLYNLPGSVLGELNRHGYLQPIFMAVASFSRVRTIIDKINAQAPVNRT